MKKKIFLLIFALILLTGCGADVNTNVYYQKENNVVEVITNVKFDQTDFNHITGGQDAVRSAMQANLKDGYTLTEEGKTFYLSKKFDSFDAYNEFAKSFSKTQTITILEGQDINVDGYKNKIIIAYEKTGDYLKDYFEAVTANLDISSSVDKSNYITDKGFSFFIDQEEYKIGEHVSDVKYETTEKFINANATIDLSKEDKELIYSSFDEYEKEYINHYVPESIDLSFRVMMSEDSLYRDEIIEKIKAEGYETTTFEEYVEVSKSGDIVSNEEESYVDGINYTGYYPRLECIVTDNAMFSYQYYCDEAPVKFELNFGESQITEFTNKYTIDNKDVTELLSQPIKVNKVKSMITGLIGLILVAIGGVFAYFKLKGTKTGDDIKAKFNSVLSFTKEKTKDVSSSVSSSIKNAKEEYDNVPDQKTSLLTKINDLVDIRLTVVLILLTTPFYSVKLPELNIKGTLFVPGDGLSDLAGLIGNDLITQLFGSVSFVHNMTILLTLITIIMFIKNILLKLKKIELSEKNNEYIDLGFYGIIAASCLMFFMMKNPLKENVVNSLAYYILFVVAVLSIVSIVKKIDIKLNIFAKYFIMMLFVPLLAMGSITIETSEFLMFFGSGPSIPDIHFSFLTLAQNNIFALITLAVYASGLIYMIYLNINDKLNEKLNATAIIVVILFLITFISLIGSTKMEVFSYTFSLGASSLAILLIILSIALAIIPIHAYFANKNKSE